MGDGDGTVVYSQATSLVKELDPTFEDTSNGSETNASQVIEGENCTLFKLYSVGHNDFGENVNGTPKKIHPDVEIKEDDKEEDIEQKTVILNYYDKISTELQKLKPQENN